MTKKKKCTSGFSCGRSCIQRSRTCRSNISKEGKKVVENYGQFVSRLSQGTAAPEALGPSAQPAATPASASAAQPSRATTKTSQEAPSLLEGELQLLNRSQIDLETLPNNDFDEVWNKNKANLQSRQAEVDAYLKRAEKGGPEAQALEKDFKDVSVGKNIKYNVSGMSSVQDIDLLANADERSRKLIMDNHNGMELIVSWTGKEGLRESGDDRTKRAAALEAARKWKKDILPKIPDGTLISNEPLGGPLGARAKGYSRQGFGSVDNQGVQYAMKIDGKLVPLQLNPLDPSVRSAFEGQELDLTKQRRNTKL